MIKRLYPVISRADIHWMSWITDHKENAGTEKETICRVYGHRLSAATTAAISSNNANASSQVMWMTMDELQAAMSADKDRQAQAGLLKLAWIKMWKFQQDEDGNPVRRGFGVATGDAGNFINWVGDLCCPSCLPVWLGGDFMCLNVSTRTQFVGRCDVLQNNQGPSGNPRGHVRFDLSDGTKPSPSPQLFSPGPVPPSEYGRVFPVEDAALLEKFAS